MQDAFYYSELDQPHPSRTRAILKAHPEVRQLIGHNPYTVLIPCLVLIAQSSIAYAMGRVGSNGWWISLIIAWGFGAFASHSTYVVVHDATHNLIFRRKFLNRLTAILADLPNLFPAAIGFGVYHLKHHSHQGDYETDADIPSRWEARLIGNKWYGKAFWLLFFAIFNLMRPPRLKAFTLWNVWTVVNVLSVIAFDIGVVYLCGWGGLWYLFCSFFFSIGLHPVGARWIQEHYTLDPDQETFSYYGPLNLVALNIGYHNEHHDFPSISWNRLPKLRALAPEFYDTLRYHTSWSRLLLQFLFDKRYTLFSRVERVDDSAPRNQHGEMESREALTGGQAIAAKTA